MVDDVHTARVAVGLAAVGRIVAGIGMVAAGRGCVRRWLGDYMTMLLGSSILLLNPSAPSWIG